MARMSTSAPSSLDRIGVGIDTARYGHRVSFLRPDRQPAAKPITVMETQAGYQSLREQLERLQGQHPQANFHVRAFRVKAVKQILAEVDRQGRLAIIGLGVQGTDASMSMILAASTAAVAAPMPGMVISCRCPEAGRSAKAVASKSRIFCSAC